MHLDGVAVQAHLLDAQGQDLLRPPAANPFDPASLILTNCRTYPKDEAPAAYKDFNEVLKSVERAGLASEVARLRARFVIKDSDDSLKGTA